MEFLKFYKDSKSFYLFIKYRVLRMYSLNIRSARRRTVLRMEEENAHFMFSQLLCVAKFIRRWLFAELYRVVSAMQENFNMEARLRKLGAAFFSRGFLSRNTLFFPQACAPPGRNVAASRPC